MFGPLRRGNEAVEGWIPYIKRLKTCGKAMAYRDPSTGIPRLFRLSEAVLRSPRG